MGTYVQFTVVAGFNRRRGGGKNHLNLIIVRYSHCSVLRCCILTSATVNSVSNFSWDGNVIKLYSGSEAIGLALPTLNRHGVPSLSARFSLPPLASLLQFVTSAVSRPLVRTSRPAGPVGPVQCHSAEIK
jgi:hypothetical protein